MPMTFFDLETVPLDGALAWAPTPKARGNLKDPEKIEADLAGKLATATARLSLDPYGCRIVVLGWTRTPREDHPIDVLSFHDTQEEADGLRLFLRECANSDLVGHNIRVFDLPVIMTRCRLLGVPFPFHWAAPRWLRYGSSIIDLYELATFGKGTHDDGVISRSLTGLCVRFGVEPDGEDITGANVGAAWAAGDEEAVRRHCHRDVIRTCALADVFDVVRARQADQPMERATPQGDPF